MEFYHSRVFATIFACIGFFISNCFTLITASMQVEVFLKCKGDFEQCTLFIGSSALQAFDYLTQGWGTCGPHEHLIWLASEFLLPNLEYNIMSKRSSMISRYLDSMSREASIFYIHIYM